MSKAGEIAPSDKFLIFSSDIPAAMAATNNALETGLMANGLPIDQSLGALTLAYLTGLRDGNGQHDPDELVELTLPGAAETIDTLLNAEKEGLNEWLPAWGIAEETVTPEYAARLNGLIRTGNLSLYDYPKGSEIYSSIVEARRQFLLTVTGKPSDVEAVKESSYRREYIIPQNLVDCSKILHEHQVPARKFFITTAQYQYTPRKLNSDIEWAKEKGLPVRSLLIECPSALPNRKRAEASISCLAQEGLEGCIPRALELLAAGPDWILPHIAKLRLHGFNNPEIIKGARLLLFNEASLDEKFESLFSLGVKLGAIRDHVKTAILKNPIVMHTGKARLIAMDALVDGLGSPADTPALTAKELYGCLAKLQAVRLDTVLDALERELADKGTVTISTVLNVIPFRARGMKSNVPDDERWPAIMASLDEKQRTIVKSAVQASRKLTKPGRAALTSNPAA